MLALYKASVRRAIGLRRSWRQKVLPFGLLAIVCIPAAVNVGIGYATRNSPLEDFSFFTYREYVGVSSALLLFVAVCAPDVVCPDRRQRVLPLIFARPLTGTDYALAKLGAITGLVFAFSFLPQVLLFVGQTLVSKDGSLRTTCGTTPTSSGRCRWPWRCWPCTTPRCRWPSSSLTTRRVVAGASIFGVTIISSIVAAILHEADALGGRGPLFNVLSLPLLVRDLIFEGHIHEGRDLSGVEGAGAAGAWWPTAPCWPSRSASCLALPVGGAVSATPPAPVPPARRPPRRRGTGPRSGLRPDPTVVVSGVSVFFGQKVALAEVSCSFGPGVTGLLGPNGAGQDDPDAGHDRAAVGVDRAGVGGRRRPPPGADGARPHRRWCPRTRPSPSGITPRELARYRAALHSVTDREAPDRWLAVVGLLEEADRLMDGFSKGMRQRAKVAAALVSNPAVLILDEPLNGADPVQRANLIRLFKQLGDQGRTVLVSSHVLYEVERLAERVVVLVRGRLAAAGDRRAIRDAMADRPRRVLVRADPPRVLAAALVGHEAVGGLEVDGDRLTVATRRAGDLALALPALARTAGVRLWEVRPLDESLEALFRELVR